MRNPSARAVEAAATEEILLRLETEVDRRFQVVDTKLRATDGALSALGGKVQETVSQMKSLQANNKNLEEKTMSQMKSLQEDNRNLEKTVSQMKSLQEDNANLQGKTASQMKSLKESLQGELNSIRCAIAEQAATARQSQGRSASVARVSPSVTQPFMKPRHTERKKEQAANPFAGTSDDDSDFEVVQPFDTSNPNPLNHNSQTYNPNLYPSNIPRLRPPRTRRRVGRGLPRSSRPQRRRTMVRSPNPSTIVACSYNRTITRQSYNPNPDPNHMPKLRPH